MCTRVLPGCLHDVTSPGAATGHAGAGASRTACPPGGALQAGPGGARWRCRPHPGDLAQADVPVGLPSCLEQQHPGAPNWPPWRACTCRSFRAAKLSSWISRVMLLPGAGQRVVRRLLRQLEPHLRKGQLQSPAIWSSRQRSQGRGAPSMRRGRPRLPSAWRRRSCACVPRCRRGSRRPPKRRCAAQDAEPCHYVSLHARDMATCIHHPQT